VKGDKGDMSPGNSHGEKKLVVLFNTLSEWLLAYMSSVSGGFAPRPPPPGLCPWRTPLGDFCPSPPVLSPSERGVATGYIGIYTVQKSGQVNFYRVTITSERLLNLFHNN